MSPAWHVTGSLRRRRFSVDIPIAVVGPPRAIMIASDSNPSATMDGRFATAVMWKSFGLAGTCVIPVPSLPR